MDQCVMMLQNNRVGIGGTRLRQTGPGGRLPPNEPLTATKSSVLPVYYPPQHLMEGMVMTQWKMTMIEPTLDDLLADEIMTPIMRSAGIDVDELRARLAETARRLTARAAPWTVRRVPSRRTPGQEIGGKHEACCSF